MKTEVLKRFVSAEHERRITEFRALDDEFTKVTRQWIRAKLCAGLPTADNLQRNSEWGVLRREITRSACTCRCVNCSKRFRRWCWNSRRAC